MLLNSFSSRSLLMAFLSLALSGCSQTNNQNTVLGTLEWDRVELVNEVSEPIIARPYTEGAKLKSGDVILKLDERRAQATLDQAIANRDLLAAKLQELENGPLPEDIEQARQTLIQSRSRLNLAQLEYTRIKKLHQQTLVSQDELDQALNEWQSAKAQLALNQANLDKLQTGTRKEQIEQAKQALLAADQQVKLHEINLQRHQIKAPSDGVLDSLPFQLGEQPNAGSVVAVMLFGKQPYARVHIPEELRASIRPGTSATVYIDGTEQVFSARVRSIQNSPDFTPYYALTEHERSRLSYLAKIDLQGSVENLPAGVPVSVTFDLTKPDTQEGS
ncbi:HlyD family efflux transporter periplasmic adaptor subunit [Thiomicrorhabdus sp. zzn3]|uniref:HlyD family secretion protein n=1 Tax=Thiomicrorhabdus sp. zzn3 TaxID=3039775 RepID=UPI0024362C34|nr:HlyD family efflux transporter periplasmic adaptor subunit [Thiomicrorhabdus sp. zzn3]MDG6778816.1 HlyD family efflux transporter periplasmic adaptor subunit [Thiomicrorhabdus sp. zzn3]